MIEEGGGSSVSEQKRERKKTSLSSPFFSPSYRSKELVDRRDEVDLRERLESREHVGGGGSLREMFWFLFFCFFVEVEFFSAAGRRRRF